MPDKKYSSWDDFFRNDPEWQKAKVHVSVDTASGIPMTKLEYLKHYGRDAFSEENYQRYRKEIENQKIRKDLFDE